MIALKIEDIKEFTSKLFMKEDFDAFLVKEVRIVTFASFSIDGRLRKEYFSAGEQEELGTEPLVPWRLLRPGCFHLIRGKRLPGSFQIVFQLPRSQILRFAALQKVDPQAVQAMYLNIRYEEGALYCITGMSLSFFTLEKTLENAWDDSAQEYLKKMGIPFTRE